MRPLLRGCVATVLGLWLVLVGASASPARADADDPLHARGHQLEGDVRYYQDSDIGSTLTVTTLAFSGRIALDARFALRPWLGLLAQVSDPEHGESDRVIGFGNPAVLATYSLHARDLRLEVGAGLSAPVAAIDAGTRGRLERSALVHAAAMDGFASLAHWAPSRTGVLTLGELTWRAHPELWVMLDAMPSVLIPSRAEFLQTAVDVHIPTSLAVLGVFPWFRVGPRLRAVLMPTAGIDKLQLSVEPLARVTLGRAFVEARFSLAIDEPLAGPRGHHQWAVHLAGGSAL